MNLGTFPDREHRPSGTDLGGRPRNRTFAARLLLFYQLCYLLARLRACIYCGAVHAKSMIFYDPQLCASAIFFVFVIKFLGVQRLVWDFNF